MPMHRLTPERSIEEHLASEIAIRKQMLIRHLNIIGNECVNQARRLGSYHDQTGNLRSSIGYIVTVDGNITHMSSFEVVKQGTEGALKGREFVRSLASRFPRGIGLIVVAGMNYASHVSTRYDVIDSAELHASRLIPAMLQRLRVTSNRSRRA